MKKTGANASTVLLRGTISGLERSRRNHNFLLTETQHQKVGVTAIAAATFGMGPAGMGLVGMANNTDEEAEWVEFELADKKVKGWLWMMPMRNGDVVEIVAELLDDYYVAYAVKREGDGLLAVYPHATAGRKVHYRKSVKIWLWCSILAYLFPMLIQVNSEGFASLLDPDTQLDLVISFAFCMCVSAIIAFRVSRKLMGYVRIAEIIFETFGWTDIENIDLRKTSIESRRENSLPNYGNLYFRYK